MTLLYGICSNGPIAGTVFEVDPLLLDVNIVTDDGSYKYARVGFGTTEKAHKIAIFAFVLLISRLVRP